MSKILIVEDNKDTVAVVKIILERAGYGVEVAFNGEEGLARAKEILPDLILLDMMMPLMDGYTMNQQLKENPKTKNIPVLIISARDGIAPLFENKPEVRIEGYLIKPISTPVLLAKIKEVLKA